MSQTVETRCDFCSKIKGSKNHWYLIMISKEGNFCVLPSTARRDQGKQNADACGFHCCTFALARFLDHGSLDERKADVSQERVTDAARV